MYNGKKEKDLEQGNVNDTLTVSYEVQHHVIPMDITLDISIYIQLITQLKTELAIISEKLNLIVNTLNNY